MGYARAMRWPVAMALVLILALGLALVASLADRNAPTAAPSSGPAVRPSVGDRLDADLDDAAAVSVPRESSEVSPAPGDGAAGSRSAVEPELEPASFVLHLRLLLPDGAPAAGAEVGAELEGDGVIQDSASAGASPAKRAGARRTEGPRRALVATDADGRCTLRLGVGAWIRIAVRHAGGTLAQQWPIEPGEHEREFTLAPAVRLVGIVRSLVTGEPIHGASVFQDFAKSPLLPPVSTDEMGRFALDVSAGTRAIQARAEGHGADLRQIEIEGDGTWRVLSVAGFGPDFDPSERGLVLELPRQRHIGGRVLRPSGAPAVGVCVRALGYVVAARGVHIREEEEVQADAEGRFAIAALRCDLTHTLWVWDGTHGAVSRLVPAGECEHDVGDLWLEGPTELRGVALEEMSSGERLPLRGRRVFLASRPPAGASVSLQTTRAKLSEFVSKSAERGFPRDAFEGDLHLDFQFAAPVADDGSFVFRGYAPGSVRLSAENSYSKRDLIAPLGLHVLDGPFVVKREW